MLVQAEGSPFKKVAVFCSIMVLMIDLSYLLIRKGFSIDFQSLLIFNGISFFLLFTPSLARQLFPKTVTENLYFGYITMPIYWIVLFSTVGFFWGDNAIYLAFFCATLGFAGFLYTVVRFFRQWDYQQLSIIIVCIFLGVWAAGKVWGIFSLHPLFIEALALLDEKELPFLHDTLFHASISQMLKTYNIPTTGLHGLPYMYYHYGSHWILGQLSSFTGTEVLTMYNLGYPLIFVPLFFYTFISLAIQLQQFFCGRIIVNGFFWLAVLCFFIPIPKGGYSLGLLGLSLLVNESQVISMIFFFFLLSVCFDLKSILLQSKIAVSLLIPIVVTAIGFIKISTAFVIVPWLGYLWIRYSGYKNRWLTVSMILCVVGFAFAYFLSVETVPFLRAKSDEGTFEFLHFYFKTHTFNPLHWFLWFYFWTYAAIILNIIYRKNLQTDSGKFRWLISETVIIIAVVGVVPSIFMIFSGGNSMYFSNIQLYVSGLICLGLFPFISDLIERILTQGRKIIVRSLLVAVVAIIFILAYREIRSDLKYMIGKSVQVRLALMEKDYSPYKKIPIFDPLVREVYKTDAGLINSNSTYQYLTNLRSLNKLPRAIKKSTLLYKSCECQDDIHWKVNCIAASHIVSAFSGVASLGGLTSDCYLGIYGATYYEGYYNTAGRKLSAAEAKEAANKLGFTNVLFYDCKQKLFKEEPSICF